MQTLYADDTIIYCSAALIDRCISKLQEAFQIVERNLCSLKLVLNDRKTSVDSLHHLFIHCRGGHLIHILCVGGRLFI